jgi:hypothetical protein
LAIIRSLSEEFFRGSFISILSGFAEILCSAYTSQKLSASYCGKRKFPSRFFQENSWRALALKKAPSGTEKIENTPQVPLKIPRKLYSWKSVLNQFTIIFENGMPTI